MFSKNEVKVDKIDTLIGSNTKFTGKIEAKGTIRIDGELIGDLIVEGSVILGEDGKIKGNSVCDNIFISGTLEGNIKCKNQLRITNTGKLFGDIEVKNFIVDESAVFEGACKMTDNPTSQLVNQSGDTRKSNTKGA